MFGKIIQSTTSIQKLDIKVYCREIEDELKEAALDITIQTSRLAPVIVFGINSMHGRTGELLHGTEVCFVESENDAIFAADRAAQS